MVLPRSPAVNPGFGGSEASRTPGQRERVVRSPSVRLLRRLEAVVILAGSFALAGFVVSHRPWVELMLGRIGPLAIPLAIVVFAVVASAPFSVTDALAIMNGVVFGPVWGSIVNALGLVLAAVIGYVVALRTADAFDVKRNVERLPRWTRRFRIGSPGFLIAVRVIPGLGGTIATQTAAALRVPIVRQIYTMCAVAVPVCTVLAVFGDAASDYIEAHVVEPAQAYAERHHIHIRRRHHELEHHGVYATVPPSDGRP